MDPTSIGIAGILVAILGVAATLLAPRLSRSARVTADIVGLTLITPESPASNVTISVAHNGAAVDKPIYLLTAVVENTGAKDIVHNHFVDPIEFVLPSDYEVLSVEVAAIDGIFPSATASTNSVRVVWRILKPREKVYVQAIVAIPENSSPTKDARKDIQRVVRLIDVKNAPSFWRGKRSLIGMLVAMIAIGVPVMTSMIVSVLTKRTDLVLVEVDSGVRALTSTSLLLDLESDLKLCQVYQEPVIFSDCRAISSNEIVSVLRSATNGEGWIGIPALMFVAGLSLVLMYACLGAMALSSPLLRTMSRMLGELSRR